MPVASFQSRIYAFLIDYVLIASYGVLVVGGISFLLWTDMERLFSESPAIAQLLGFFMMTLPVSLYFIISEQSSWQGSWGKRVLGLHVINKAGGRIGVFQSAIRSAVKFLPWEIAHFGIWRLVMPTDFPEGAALFALSAANLTAIAYLVFPLFNEKRKNIYDMAAGTTVIVKNE
ncbi:RDD family protein [Thalassobacillus pellis]|uniref:RDD family protein n=1 Tax=Thalassobacillus pellis TaxID=748008 RepID=UPI00195FE00F|nr:RDD family protein [Thalassobacillus pellis]MBM7552010.1 putative RDD family membrane protein YckC [Thalassobacillus pellis]